MTNNKLLREGCCFFEKANKYYQSHPAINSTQTFYEWMEEENGVCIELDHDSLLLIKGWDVIDDAKYLTYYLKFR
jgi:hypothetical protein